MFIVLSVARFLYFADLQYVLDNAYKLRNRPFDIRQQFPWEIDKSTAHGCWTLNFFISDIKLQAIYKVIHTSNYDGHISKYVCKIGKYNQKCVSLKGHYISFVGVDFGCSVVPK
jgi:hypothetical protein